MCQSVNAAVGAAQVALNIPDELTLDHIWKDKKREYAFDAVFTPGATQEKVCPVRIRVEPCAALSMLHLCDSTCLVLERSERLLDMCVCSLKGSHGAVSNAGRG